MFGHPAAVDGFEIVHDLVQRHVVKCAALVHIFHVPVAGLVKGVIDRIVAPVKRQRQQTELVAQLDVEGGGGLDPLAFQPDVGIAMPDEHIGLHGLAQALGAQVVAHIGIAQPGVQTMARQTAAIRAALGTHQPEPWAITELARMPWGDRSMR